VAQSGGQPGNQNAAKAKRWSAAIERATAAFPNPPDDTDCSDLIKGLNAAAHAFVAKLHAEKDLGFFREYGDRLEGKSIQGVELGGPDGGEIRIASITRKIVDPRGP